MKAIHKQWVKEGNQYVYRTKSLRVDLHHHIDYAPHVWFVSCYGPLRAERVELAAKDDQEAQAEALDVLREKAARALKELEP